MLEAAPKCFFTGSESDVRHLGPSNPSNLEAASKCFCFFTGSKSDVRHRGLPFKPLKALQTPQTPQIPQKPRNLPEGACSRLLQNVFLRDPKATLDIWALQTPQTSRLLQNVFVFLRDPKATLDIGACPSNPSKPFKPLKPLKSLKSLETCQKGLARGCSHPKATLDIWALQTPQTSRLLQNVFVFLRDPKATLDIGACPSNPSNPSNPSKASKLARRGLLEAAPKCFFTGSESDVRHLGLPVKPRKPLKSLKSLETCQKGLARGCSKMFFYGIRKRR